MDKKFRTLSFIVVLIISVSYTFADFNKDFHVSWGNDHAKILDNGRLWQLSLDNTSGSGFESKEEYMFGKIDLQIKLVPGNSAGTVTAYYLSSQGSTQDEIDFEFLGNLSGEPYLVHTNLYTQGHGKREQQFYFWFDPTADFRTYSVLWNPQNIIFYVDSTPIRVFRNGKDEGVPYPDKEAMKIYSSIWNGDRWATRGGRVKINWDKAPFVASFRNFEAEACVWSGTASLCSSGKWWKQGLNSSETQRLAWVRKNYMIYDYCKDTKRFPARFPPECSLNTP